MASNRRDSVNDPFREDTRSHRRSPSVSSISSDDRRHNRRRHYRSRSPYYASRHEARYEDRHRDRHRHRSHRDSGARHSGQHEPHHEPRRRSRRDSHHDSRYDGDRHARRSHRDEGRDRSRSPRRMRDERHARSRDDSPTRRRSRRDERDERHHGSRSSRRNSNRSREPQSSSRIQRSPSNENIMDWFDRKFERDELGQLPSRQLSQPTVVSDFSHGRQGFQLRRRSSQGQHGFSQRGSSRRGSMQQDPQSRRNSRPQSSPIGPYSLEGMIKKANDPRNNSWPASELNRFNEFQRRRSTGSDNMDSSAAVTPKIESSDASPDGSLMQIDDTKDAPNDANQGNAEIAQERSAADYDPTFDMQQDRERSDNRHEVGEMAAGAYHEAEANDKEILPEEHTDGAKLTTKTPKKDSDDIDMFASEGEDDDDMFAAPIAPRKPSAPRVEPAKQDYLDDIHLRDNWDDPDGYYRATINERFGRNHVVRATLGRGMFASVIRAQEEQTGKMVAIKVIRSNDLMRKAAHKEIDFLQKLRDADPEDKKHVVSYLGSFLYRGHLSVVFENLSMNLREVVKKFGHDIGLHLSAVRAYAGQTFLALSLFRKCNLIHADLKPDNVLVDETRSTLKVCDLGSAVDIRDANDITPYLVSRFYRAPEIILGMKPDYAVDMWSIGCTLYELYTSKILFAGRNNNQMLRVMMECRGKFSVKMLRKAAFAGDHFDDSHQVQFRSLEKDRFTGLDVVKLLHFGQQPAKPLKERVFGAAQRNGGLDDFEKEQLGNFVDLLDRCLALNPEKRITPSEALKHPFMQRGSSKAGAAHGKK